MCFCDSLVCMRERERCMNESSCKQPQTPDLTRLHLFLSGFFAKAFRWHYKHKENLLHLKLLRLEYEIEADNQKYWRNLPINRRFSSYRSL